MARKLIPGSSADKFKVIETTKLRPERKRRTREHVWADMSLHHVAFLIAKCGFTLDPVRADYGYDASIQFYGPDGQVENGHAFVQLKATSDLERLMTAKGISFRVDKKDFDLWVRATYPV